MNKCEWCGAELEDRAEVCAYCGREVHKLNSAAPVSPEAERMFDYFPNPDGETHEYENLPPVTQTENIPQAETKELPPLKWHQNIFLRAILFGICMAFLLTQVVVTSTSPTGPYGYSGYISNALLTGFSNFVVYFGLYLLLGNIYRGSKKKRKYADLDQRRAILRSEFTFVIGIISLLFIAFFGIEKVLSTAGNRTAVEPTIMKISTDTIIPTKIATPTKIMATPTKKVSTTDSVINQQERALKNSLIAYKDEPNWAFKPYLDDLDLVINGNAVIITLLKSPVTEAEFKEVAYELIRVTAHHVIHGPISVKRSDWALDFNVYSIRVITKKMADYTIAGYVEGYENIKKMADEKHTEDLVTYEKYYK